MIDLRTLAIGVFGIALSATPVGAQGQAQYREFQLGADLASVSALSGIAVSEAKVIHERPAVMKELSWRPSYWISGSSKPQTDPVQQIVFSFYNDQLFRLVIDYDRQRTDGMTDLDMMDAISIAYGPPLTAKPRSTAAVGSQIETESGTALARWGDADYSVVLYRSEYASVFRLVVTSPKLDTLARTSAAQSLRLDAREAPQRERARQEKEKEEGRAAQAKARETNKELFRP